MKKLRIFLFIILLVFSLVNCSTDPETEVPLSLLYGTWVSGYGEYFIFDDSSSYYEYGQLTGDYAGTYIEAKIHEIVTFDSDNTSGLVIFEYMPAYVYGSDSFSAAYFTDRTAKSARISASPWEGDFYTGSEPRKGSVAEVRSFFTVHNVSTYFGMTSACAKQ